MNFEQVIREHAYFKWLASGDAHGNAETYWLAAETEILVASMETVARVMESPEYASDACVLLKPKTTPRAVSIDGRRGGRSRNASASSHHVLKH